MKNLHKNIRGFAHPVLLVVVLVALVGLIGYSGQRVWTKKKQATSTSNTVPTASTSTTPQSYALTSPETVTVGGTNSAAAQAPQTTPSASAQVSTSYDVKTPQGSLNQLIKELKTRNFSNALYFITPRFMFQSAKAAQTLEPITLERCLSNSVCKNLMNADIDPIDTNQVYDYTPENVNAPGKYLSFNMTWKDGKLINQHPRYGGEYRVKVYMIDIGSNWVVDKLEVNDIVI